MIFYFNQSGQVRFHSDSKTECDFNYLEYEPTKEEYEFIKMGYNMAVQDGKLILTKPPHLEKEEKDQAILDLRTKINADQAEGKADMADVIALLNKILN